MALYLDSSALVKLVDREPDSDELRAFVGDREMVSSQISRTESSGPWRGTSRNGGGRQKVLSGDVTLIVAEPDRSHQRGVG